MSPNAYNAVIGCCRWRQFRRGITTSTPITNRTVHANGVPVSIDAFENDAIHEPTASEQVIAYLVGNDDKAFTRGEIAADVDADAERPLVVLTDDTHPFHGEQWIAAGVSTVPRPRALELTRGGVEHRSRSHSGAMCIRGRCFPHGSSRSTTSSGASRESSSTK